MSALTRRQFCTAAAAALLWARRGIEAAMGEANRADLDRPSEPA